jgi:O-methyltransferase
MRNELDQVGGCVSDVIAGPIPQRRKRGIEISCLRYAIGAIPLFLKYKARTMLSPRSYIENLALMSAALRDPDLRKGAIVECGTWRGGMSAGMIETGGPERRYYFFDSFEGLPPAQEIDGREAKQWQANAASPNFHNNCSASLDDFRESIGMTGCPPSNISIRKGFFEDTLPAFDPPSIAVLRLDADWYASTMVCLESLWDHVLVGGLVLIDDYYTWDGCSKAVHAFLAKRRAPERIHEGPVGHTAFILKKSQSFANLESATSR